MTTELLPDNLINAMTTVFCGQMYDEYGDVEFQHAKRAILVMVDNFNLVERARPVPSSDAVALKEIEKLRADKTVLLEQIAEWAPIIKEARQRAITILEQKDN